MIPPAFSRPLRIKGNALSREGAKVAEVLEGSALMDVDCAGRTERRRRYARPVMIQGPTSYRQSGVALRLPPQSIGHASVAGIIFDLFVCFCCFSF